MTEEDAKTIVGIMLSADGECPYCAYWLVRSFIDSFPEWAEVAVKTYEGRFGYDSDIKREPPLRKYVKEISIGN